MFGRWRTAVSRYSRIRTCLSIPTRSARVDAHLTLSSPAINREDGKAEETGAFIVKLYRQGVYDKQNLVEIGMTAATDLEG